MNKIQKKDQNKENKIKAELEKKEKKNRMVFHKIKL